MRLDLFAVTTFKLSTTPEKAKESAVFYIAWVNNGHVSWATKANKRLIGCFIS